MSEQSKIRVMIVDDHAVVHSGLGAFLSVVLRFVLVGARPRMTNRQWYVPGRCIRMCRDCRACRGQPFDSQVSCQQHPGKIGR
jgi:hypothetical protein